MVASPPSSRIMFGPSSGLAVGAGPGQDLLGGPPVFLQRLALPGEHGNTLGVLDGSVADHHGGGGFVLGGEDVAGGPADLGAEGREGLDQHGGLHGHVQGSGDPGALERLAGAELLAQGHQAGHFVLGEADLVAACLGQGDVRNLVIESHVSPLLWPAGRSVTWLPGRRWRADQWLESTSVPDGPAMGRRPSLRWPGLGVGAGRRRLASGWPASCWKRGPRRRRGAVPAAAAAGCRPRSRSAASSRRGRP